ncbi:TetR/AcrR family transcriptional regulator [Amycolatopsis acidiphila]|uniref:TetR/AcrR family transcriptional regulator n=1 Tax=Amycolatopsis acidiphila TaxID=715473 RepID=A0A558AM10_9PSEU|nr:TetR/AcrR family transcriptional regulator [Amycolatopsis acidiphila]TVT25296.1 TetR/AcrR family transcriptional regulator [Amycolatopsis acidiphila]UIJ62419.1 TetR/AcrR family transcriptional regulator [Amycolatopsis acidiphila]GHG83585.1 TetR family transcriptional regulator [Amycolatopsis acidiphila]
MDRDRKILDTAAAVFYEKGFHGVGVDELGKRAGLSGPALYRHFSGKDEILAALFNEALDELLSATAPVHEDAAKDLERLIRHHVGFAVGHRHLVNIYQREDRSLVDPWKRQFDRRRRQYIARWEAAVTRCFPDTRQDEIAAGTQACLGVIFSIAYWPAKLAQTPALADLVAGFASEGLATLRR